MFRGRRVVVREVLAVDSLISGKAVPAAQVDTHTDRQTDTHTATHTGTPHT